MGDTEEAINRYGSGRMREQLHTALRSSRLEPEVLKHTDLDDADHFHLGGRAATEFIADSLGIMLGSRLIDLGSGLGGPARYCASLGAVVTGVDVTSEFVELARELNQACGMGGSITMFVRPAQETALPDGSFDAAMMLHVGMNIAQKKDVFSEAFRILRPGGVLGIYDLMGSNHLHYPLPWADTAESSYVESEKAYTSYLQAAGFEISSSIDRRKVILKSMGNKNPGTPGTLSRPMVSGDQPDLRMKHVMEGIGADLISPRLLIATKP